MHRQAFLPPVVTALALFMSACTGGSQAENGQGRNAAESRTASHPVSAKDYSRSRFGDSAGVRNRWYPLQPGTRLDYRGSAFEEGKRLPHGVTVIVTDLTKRVDGVENAVVWERDYSEGELVERELSLFAEDKDGNVWHTGEYPEEWEGGKFVKAPAWVHGVKGATAGVTIPANPTVGTPGFAEGYAPPPIDWTDHGRVYKTGQRVCVPAGCYGDVAVIAEFSPDISDAFQDKYYAPGVGVVRVGWRGTNDESKEVLELVSFRTLTRQEMREARSEALALEDRAYRISGDVWGTTARARATGH